MNPLPPFRVIGVRADGDRIVIFRQWSRDAAERVIRLIEHASPYSALCIESDDEVKATLPKRRAKKQPA